MAFAFSPVSYYRWPIAVSPGAAASTAIRVQVSITPALRRFWSSVDSNGYSVRFADATGGPLAFNRASFSYANQTAEYRVQFTTPSGVTTRVSENTNCLPRRSRLDVATTGWAMAAAR